MIGWILIDKYHLHQTDCLHCLHLIIANCRMISWSKLPESVFQLYSQWFHRWMHQFCIRMTNQRLEYMNLMPQLSQTDMSYTNSQSIDRCRLTSTYLACLHLAWFYHSLWSLEYAPSSCINSFWRIILTPITTVHFSVFYNKHQAPL